MLGRDAHIRTHDGDEVTRVTPWVLFSQEDAVEADEQVRQAVSLAEAILDTAAKDRAGD